MAAGFALLGLTVSLALGGWLLWASQDLEHRLIDEALGAELEDYLAREGQGQTSPSHPCNLAGILTEGLELHRPRLRHKPVTLGTRFRHLQCLNGSGHPWPGRETR